MLNHLGVFVCFVLSLKSFSFGLVTEVCASGLNHLRSSGIHHLRFFVFEASGLSESAKPAVYKPVFL